jgi:hypothetical protein
VNFLFENRQCYNLDAWVSYGLSSINFAGDMFCTLYDQRACEGKHYSLLAPSPDLNFYGWNDLTRSFLCYRKDKRDVVVSPASKRAIAVTPPNANMVGPVASPSSNDGVELDGAIDFCVDTCKSIL